jgi:hypothetical protein
MLYTPFVAADAISCSLLKTAAEHAGDRNWNAGCDKASNQIADPTGERDTEKAN